jgi:hypothetical protein
MVKGLVFTRRVWTVDLVCICLLLCPTPRLIPKAMSYPLSMNPSRCLHPDATIHHAYPEGGHSIPVNKG